MFSIANLIALASRLGDLINPPSNAVTEGPSPKVAVPTLILVLVGTALIIVGAIVGDGQVLGYGVALIVASGVVAGAGAAAGPGSVVVGAPVVGVPSDAVLDDQAAAAIKAIEPGDTPVERRV